MVYAIYLARIKTIYGEEKWHHSYAYSHKNVNVNR